jgi:hypothetical protein
MLASLAGYTSKTGSETVHDLIDLSVSASKSGLDNTVSTALTTAVQVIENQAGAANLKTDLVDPLLDLIKDEQLPFESRLLLAGSLGRLERDGFIPSELVEMPNLRMQEVAGLSDKEKTALRETAEAGLFEPTSLHELMGDGPLGKLFPAVFGKHSEGGIVGRPQHGGHEFPLDAHILKVVEKTANHPKFTSLSRKDQINLLWASLFHDVAKRPNMIDEGHDERSSMVSWGVLKTLGYPQQRIQRIANLVERHGEVSYQPPGTEQAWQDGLDDLAAGTRHPSSTLQMRILNESDIASIDSSGSYLTDAVRVQLANQSNRLESRSNQLSVNSLPLLTTQVPHRFGIFEMSKPYALLAHVSDHINTTFLKQLPSLESRTFSASTTVITDKFRALASTKSPSMVAILEGPAENISQAYPENLATGRFVDWKGQVNLVKDWTNADKAEELATRVDTKLKSLGFGNSAPLSALAEVRGKLAQFDTADELTDSKTDARLLQAHNIIISALTTSHGEPLRYSNEAKINNPSVSAIGIFSQGKPVVLDGAPSGLTSSSVPIHQDDSLVIPKAVWQEAQRRNLPFLILDPSDCIETSPHPDRY